MRFFPNTPRTRREHAENASHPSRPRCRRCNDQAAWLNQQYSQLTPDHVCSGSAAHSRYNSNLRVVVDEHSSRGPRRTTPWQAGRPQRPTTQHACPLSVNSRRPSRATDSRRSQVKVEVLFNRPSFQRPTSDGPPGISRDIPDRSGPERNSNFTHFPFPLADARPQRLPQYRPP